MKDPASTFRWKSLVRSWRVLICMMPAIVAQAQTSEPIPPEPRSEENVAPAPTQSPDQIQTGFDWRQASKESTLFLSVQHGLRLAAPKTRAELGGPFFKDWKNSIKGIRTWSDGDSPLTAYVGHPMMGSVAGYIQVQNDPRGRHLEFSNTRKYWHSRLRAMGWSAAYSTNFEIGPWSEASFGNVGLNPGTNGYVDLVVTPFAGFGWMVMEDWLDKRLVQKLEQRTQNRRVRRIIRITFNPTRAISNALRFKPPWHRDTRPAPTHGSIPLFP